MKKKRLLLTIFLLLIPSVFAEITITIDKSEFNLGDELAAGVEIIEENDLEGFFRLSIICDDNTFEYYATPISLEANVNKEIDIPYLVLFEDFIGECHLDGVLKSQKDDIIDQTPSTLFIVSNALNMFLSKSTFTSNPGEEINIKGSVKNSYDTNIDNANITLILDNEITTFAIKKGIIDYNFKIPGDIKSGDHFMDITIEDNYGNKGKEVIGLEVNQVPTTIDTKLNKDLFIPSETLQVEITLLDQADDFIDETINFEIINPENGKIYLEEVRSEGIAKYTFEQYAVPGEYRLRSFFNDIVTEDIVAVQEYEKLKLSLEDNIVSIKNIGNIKYKKKSTIILEDEKNNEYIIRKKLNLVPSEFITIDLSKEVPEGNYKVELPEETVENIPIEDNRNLLKKTGQSLSGVTGKIVGTSDKAIFSPFTAAVILVLMIIVIGINKNNIKRLFKRD